MEQSAIVGFSANLTQQDIHDFRDSPFCSLEVFAQMVDVSTDVVRGWVENNTIPTAKLGRRRVVNLHRFRNDLSTGKTIFCQGDYEV